MLHFEILPQTSKNLHRLICHICDISQLCNSAPSVKMSRESDPDDDTDRHVNYLDGYWDGYDKAAQQFVDDYYRNGDYTSDDQNEGEEQSESSDSDSDEESSDSESDSNEDKDKDEDHKYKYKYKYKYKTNDKHSDKSSDEPKDEPKDDKQTDQKYSVNTVVRQCPLYDTDDSSDEEPIWLYGN